MSQQIRTDVKIDQSKIIYLTGGSVRRGDIITWEFDKGVTCFGRVICMIKPLVKIEPTDFDGWYVCVAWIHGGVASEFWVKPDDITSSATPTGLLKWMFSDEFLTTPIDKARNCFNDTGESLIIHGRGNR